MAKKVKADMNRNKITADCDDGYDVAFDVSKYFATTIAKGYKGMYIAPDVEILDILKFLSKEINGLIIRTNCNTNHPFCIGNEITVSIGAGDTTRYCGDILGNDIYGIDDTIDHRISLFEIDTETRELSLASVSIGSIRSFGNLCWKTGAIEVKIGNKSYRTRKELVDLGFFVRHHSTDQLPKHHVFREMLFGDDTAISDDEEN